MALQKEIELQTGITADYWKIIGLKFDTLKNTAVVIFGLYKDAESRQAGKDYIVTRQEIIEGVTDEQIKQSGVSPLQLCYGYMKMTEYFSQSVDC